MEGGVMPNSIWVTLENDLVDSCKPGDRVVITGFVRRRWKPPIPGKLLEVDFSLMANHMVVNNAINTVNMVTPIQRNEFKSFWEGYQLYPLYARNLILQSFCPELFGMYLLKLAVAITLAGGTDWRKLQKLEDSAVAFTRSEAHLLMIGDPGTGKSLLLKYAAKVIPRSVLTTGVGSTSVGLTATAIKEDGDWQIEGGALVLADGGICCIDEFSSMKKHDQCSILEAMEQQTISIAKAGINCKLNTKCSILAATNNKIPMKRSKCDALSMNIGLSSPLLSRFDLVLLVSDEIDETWDKSVTSFVLSGHKYKTKYVEDKMSVWNLQMHQAYFMVIKELHPVLTEDANKILKTYYQLQRRIEGRNKARTTVRLLNSLIRLSQGHARLMYREKVIAMDAITAVSLMESSMEEESAVLNLGINLRSQFPDDPTESYAKLARAVLACLQLPDILRKEEELLNLAKGNMTQAQSKYFKTIPKDNSSDHSSEVLLNPKHNLKNTDLPTTSILNDISILQENQCSSEIESKTFDVPINSHQDEVVSDERKDNKKKDFDQFNVYSFERRGYQGTSKDSAVCDRSVFEIVGNVRGKIEKGEKRKTTCDYDVTSNRKEHTKKEDQHEICNMCENEQIVIPKSKQIKTDFDSEKRDKDEQLKEKDLLDTVPSYLYDKEIDDILNFNFSDDEQNEEKTSNPKPKEDTLNMSSFNNNHCDKNKVLNNASKCFEFTSNATSRNSSDIILTKERMNEAMCSKNGSAEVNNDSSLKKQREDRLKELVLISQYLGNKLDESKDKTVDSGIYSKENIFEEKHIDDAWFDL